MNKPGEPMPHEVDDLCDFFVEQNEYTPSAFRMLDNIRNDEIVWWRKRIGNLTPGTKSGSLAIPLLQVADLGAFWQPKKWLLRPMGKCRIWVSVRCGLGAFLSTRPDWNRIRQDARSRRCLLHGRALSSSFALPSNSVIAVSLDITNVMPAAFASASRALSA